MRQPCLDCGTPTDGGSRCPIHYELYRQRQDRTQTARRRGRGGRAQYSSTHRRGAEAVRAAATRCWLCGGGPRPDDPWQADHVIPVALDPAARAGQPSVLAAAHRSCNIARGNRARSSTPDRTRTTPLPTGRAQTP